MCALGEHQWGNVVVVRAVRRLEEERQDEEEEVDGKKAFECKYCKAFFSRRQDALDAGQHHVPGCRRHSLRVADGRKQLLEFEFEFQSSGARSGAELAEDFYQTLGTRVQLESSRSAARPGESAVDARRRQDTAASSAAERLSTRDENGASAGPGSPTETPGPTPAGARSKKSGPRKGGPRKCMFAGCCGGPREVSSREQAKRRPSGVGSETGTAMSPAPQRV